MFPTSIRLESMHFRHFREAGDRSALDSLSILQELEEAHDYAMDLESRAQRTDEKLMELRIAYSKECGKCLFTLREQNKKLRIAEEIDKASGNRDLIMEQRKRLEKRRNFLEWEKLWSNGNNERKFSVITDEEDDEINFNSNNNNNNNNNNNSHSIILTASPSMSSLSSLGFWAMAKKKMQKNSYAKVHPWPVKE